MNERIKIESEPLYLSHLQHTHSLIGAHESERRSSLNVCERDCCCVEIILLFWDFTVLVLILSLRKLWGFLLYGFPEEKLFVSLVSYDVLMFRFIAVLVILSVKRS